MDQLVSESSQIVRGTVTGASPLIKGEIVYTQYTVTVSETLKGAAAAQVNVVEPGGQSGSQQQIFSGSPQLQAGQEYVFFLWAGKSGRLQIIGLSQGLFTLQQAANGDLFALRVPSGSEMLDFKSRLPVSDTGVKVRWADLKAQIAAKLGGQKQ